MDAVKMNEEFNRMFNIIKKWLNEHHNRKMIKDVFGIDTHVLSVQLNKEYKDPEK